MPEVFLNGNAGRIETRYTPRDGNRIALVLHPHPLYGGNLHNKVVYNMAKTLGEKGYSVLRPNFRGVGRSEGEYSNGEGELYDAVAAFDWLQARHIGARSCVVAGFSFGAYIAIQLLMRRPEVSWFAAVAPPVHHFDMSFISPCPAPGLVIQGKNDAIVPHEQVQEFVYKLKIRSNARVDYRLLEGADHFFSGKIAQVSSLIAGFADDYEEIRSKQDEASSAAEFLTDNTDD